MNAILRNALAVAALAISAQAAAEITFYEREGFQGRSFTTDKRVDDFQRFGFYDRASSAVVVGDRWEVCEDSRSGGRCLVLRPGRYSSLTEMGLNDRVSSVREVRSDARIDDYRYAPMPRDNDAPAQITFYEGEGFRGQTFTTDRRVGNFERFGFNDRASSVVVLGDRWEVCEDVRFGGRCVVLRPGRYPSLAAMGLNNQVSSVREVSRDARIEDYRYAPMPRDNDAPAQITFYEREGFRGETFTTDKRVGNFERFGFNDRASSVVVLGDRWEVCEDVSFGGRCVVLRPGRYPSLAAMGLNNSVSSTREVNRDARIDDNRYAPAPVAAYDNRRRNNERLYEANITSSRAVVATPEKRCWVEPGQVQERSKLNIPGAVIGGVIGGILGHQIGSGRGNDVATVGGVVGGAAVGANVGRGQTTQTPDVQRCENVPNKAQADYWDVTYNFRGQEHRIQMTTPPGTTVTVNEEGEPRS